MLSQSDENALDTERGDIDGGLLTKQLARMN